VIRAYQWTMHAEAVESFQCLTKRRRARLIRAFEHLAAHPWLEPRIRSRDAEQREISTTFDETIAIHYRADHAARCVHILRLVEE